MYIYIFIWWLQRTYDDSSPIFRQTLFSQWLRETSTGSLEACVEDACQNPNSVRATCQHQGTSQGEGDRDCGRKLTTWGIFGEEVLLFRVPSCPLSKSKHVAVARRRMAQSTSRVLSHRDRSDFDLMSAIVSSRIPGVRFTLDGAVHTEYVVDIDWLPGSNPLRDEIRVVPPLQAPAVAFSSHRSTTAARQRRWAPTLESASPGVLRRLSLHAIGRAYHRGRGCAERGRLPRRGHWRRRCRHIARRGHDARWGVSEALRTPAIWCRHGTRPSRSLPTSTSSTWCHIFSKRKLLYDGEDASSTCFYHLLQGRPKAPFDIIQKITFNCWNLGHFFCSSLNYCLV